MRIRELNERIGIERKNMPQVKSKHYKKLFQYLTDSGVTYKKQIVDPHSLDSIQKNYNRKETEKHLTAIEKFGMNTKPVLISSNDLIIDGNHRWLAAKEAGSKLKAIRLSEDFNTLYNLIKKFPHIIYKEE